MTVTRVRSGAANLPWEFTQSDDASLTLTFEDAATDPIDLSAVTWVAKVLASPGSSTVLATITVTTASAASGIIVLSLADTVTATLPRSSVWYLRDDTNDRTYVGGELVVLRLGEKGRTAAGTNTATVTVTTTSVTVSAVGTAAMSAAQILDALLTVDGPGSGLDADTLDGTSSAGFAAAGHNHTGTYDPAGTAAASVSAHEGDTDPHGDRDYADGIVATHEADTTNVHGIADTATLVALAALSPSDGYVLVGNGTAWTAQPKWVVDARDYGAVGDGTTDDTAALNAAWAAVPDGGTLVIPPTTNGYLTSSPLTFTGKTRGRVTSGGGKTWIKSNNKTAAIIQVGHVSSGCRVGLDGLRLGYTVALSESDTAAIAIQSQNMAHGSWDDIEIISCYSGIVGAGLPLGGSTNYFFSMRLGTVYIYDYYGYGIHVEPTATGNTHNYGANVYISGDASLTRNVLGAVRLIGTPFAFGALNIEGARATAGSLVTFSGQGSWTVESLHMEEAQGINLVLASRAQVTIGNMRIHSTTFDGAVIAFQTILANYLDGSFDIGVLALSSDNVRTGGATVTLFAPSFASGGGYSPSLVIRKLIDLGAPLVNGTSNYGELVHLHVGASIKSVSLAGTAGAGYLEGVEQTSDPAAPAANSFRLFAKDNGSGKTQLCVRFATGAVQVVATEP